MASVGIDFGNAYSCVGVWRTDSVEIVANDQGSRQNPSMVAFNEEEMLCGEAAKSQAAMNPANTVFDIKYMLGRKFSDAAIQKKVKTWPFKVSAGKDDIVMVEVDFKGKKTKFSAEQLASFVLADCADIACKFISSPVTHAVLSIPAAFTPAQTAALEVAAAAAKLTVLRLIKEPIAAAVGCGLDDVKDGSGEGSQNVCVLDFGASTCDIALVSVSDGILSLQKHAQDAELSGKEFENQLLDYFKAIFEKKNKTKIEGKDQLNALGRLRTVCQKALSALSSGPTASIELDSLFAGKDLYEQITRARFESLAYDSLAQGSQLLKSTFDAEAKAAVQQVVLVGGCTRMPKFRAMVSEFWGKDVAIDLNRNPNELIALGAAVQAHLLAPHAKSKELNNLPSLDCTTLSLGLGVAGGVVYPVVPRGAVLPCSRSVVLTTAVNAQASAILRVYQGERLQASGNVQLGSVVLPKLPAGTAEITVVFSLDEKAQLTVSATSGDATAEEKMGAGDSKQDAAKAIAEAAKFAKEDEAFFKQLTTLQSLRSEVAELKAQKDNDATVVAAVVQISKWIAELDAKESVPALALILAKKAELTVACTAEESEEDDDDESGEDETESEAESDDDEDLD